MQKSCPKKNLFQEVSGFTKSFKTWMDEHKELRDMIANGKDKLEWTRKVKDL